MKETGIPKTKREPILTNELEKTSTQLKSTSIQLQLNFNTTYSQMLFLANPRKINLNEIGIKEVRLKRAINRRIILEISGRKSPSKALAVRFREILTKSKVKIIRPIKMAELRLTDLDESPLMM